MPFDAHEIFANLAEKEKVKGHHSPEGRAIRTLSRTLNGWSGGSLKARDVLALCDQAIEDWLKERLKLSSWSQPHLTALLAKTVEKNLITRLEAVRLQKLRHLRDRDSELAIAAQQVEAALDLCIQIVDRHW